jgi:hypothetical protein
MRICVLTTTPPYPLDEGERLRVFHLLRHLPERHELDLVACTETPAASVPRALGALFAETATVPPPPAVPVSGWRRLTGRWRKSRAAVPPWIAAQHSAALQDLLDARAAARRYDLFLVYNAFMTQYRLPPGIPVVVDLIDSPTLRLRRQLGQIAAPGRKAIQLLSWIETRRYLRRVSRVAKRTLASSRGPSRAAAC